jgi:hypothetical protein
VAIFESVEGERGAEAGGTACYEPGLGHCGFVLKCYSSESETFGMEEVLRAQFRIWEPRHFFMLLLTGIYMEFR